MTKKLSLVALLVVILGTFAISCSESNESDESNETLRPIQNCQRGRWSRPKLLLVVVD